MKRLIMYLRECFCKHDLIYEEIIKSTTDYNPVTNKERIIEQYKVIHMRCKKCTFHHSYRKDGNL